MQHLKTWWTAYGAGITAAAIAFLPVVQAWASHHPGQLASVVGGLIAAAGLSKSPLSKS